ncbi:MAG: phosphoribosylanthranilate isomerase [Eubacterium sp.]|nr:phosphoribosylanthranilate isomerase [Eubacterium sp.]
MNQNLQVKICGITTSEEVDWLNQYRPDYAGFVLFFPKSKRNLELEHATRLIHKLDKKIQSVAVTVKPTKEQVELIRNAGFSCLQIHGDVGDEVIELAGMPVWKAFNVTDLNYFTKYDEMENVRGFVLDAATPGSGRVFDWSLLSTIPETEKRVMLAGGISLDNVAQAMKVPNIDGVDTSSGVEKACGIGKDRKKLEQFIYAVKGDNNGTEKN